MNFRFEEQKQFRNVIFHAGLWYDAEFEAREAAWGINDPQEAREVEKEFKRDLHAFIKANGAETDKPKPYVVGERA